jgi:farnesol dehydrogenase
MRIFITGGTGYIGTRLAEKLAVQGNEVVILARDPDKCIKLDNVTSVVGDILDAAALKKGMTGCELVFHMAAFTKPWSKDRTLPYKTNVTGTKNVIEAAIGTGVRKIVITSTGGTMGWSRHGMAVDESTNQLNEFHTEYERTKAEAENMAIEFSRNGIDISIVNPTRVYGPGLISKTNILTFIIQKYLAGKWRIMPGNGKSIGNYVFVDDVVDGHILAGKSGRSGERYILGGENLSFIEVAEKISEESGIRKKLFPFPFSAMRFISGLSSVYSGIFRVAPFLTREWIEKYSKDWIISSDKAVTELGYKITPFRTGVAETIRWIKTEQSKNG